MLKKEPEKAVYEDLHSLPDNMIGEIMDGEIIAVPRPSYRHSYVASGITGEIRGPFQSGSGGPGGWIILYEPEICLGDNILVPDLAAWKRERLPEPPETNFTTIPPDWVCEVLSHRTVRIDRIRKMPLYARFGVSYCWLADPGARTLEVFRLESGKWVLVGVHGENEQVRIEPFQEIEVCLANLWWT